MHLAPESSKAPLSSCLCIHFSCLFICIDILERLPGHGAADEGRSAAALQIPDQDGFGFSSVHHVLFRRVVVCLGRTGEYLLPYLLGQTPQANDRLSCVAFDLLGRNMYIQPLFPSIGEIPRTSFRRCISGTLRQPQGPLPRR